MSFSPLGLTPLIGVSHSAESRMEHPAFAKSIWWTRGDSNPRPPRCERGALPAELLAHEQQQNLSRRSEPCQLKPPV
jgi:hypothetical protein